MSNLYKIIAIDPSTSKTGYCTAIIDNDTETKRIQDAVDVDYGVISTHKFVEGTFYKIIRIITAVSELLDDDRIEGSNRVMFIEGYSYGSFGKSSSVSDLVELSGAMKYMAFTQDVDFFAIPPTTIKKFLCGSGNAKKEDMKLNAYKKYGIEFKTSDEADAYALADLAISAIFGRHNPTKKEQETIEVVKSIMEKGLS